MPEFLDFSTRFKRVVIVCHPNADPDCLGAAYALQECLRKKHKTMEITVLTPEGVNSVSDRLIASLSLRVEDELPKSVDLFILVDLSSLEQVPRVKETILARDIPYAILDHHVPDNKTLDNAAIAIVKERSSTCEVVYETVNASVLSKTALTALLTGLIYDSRRFLNYPEQSIESAHKMIELGADPSKAMTLLTTDEDPSERMAKLKGAARLRLFQADNYRIAVTNVGSFEAAVARALTTLGADLALVVAENGKDVRISGRSTDIFFRSSSLNLASDIMQPLATTFSGHGGGHPTAASANAKCDAESMVSSALDLIAKKLGSTPKEINTKK